MTLRKRSEFSQKTSHTSKSFGFPKGQSRFSGSTGSSFKRTQKPKRTIKTFDPSLFIKQVEEQVQTPTFTPEHSFADFAIDDRLKENIAQKGYIHPTPIQDKAIPAILQGHDVIATANTGTGKTAAFLIPLIQNLFIKKINRVLVLTPTRELAEQIQDELMQFKDKMGIFSAVCIGGVNINPQIQRLQKKPQFVIGTPGRLLDLENNNALRFESFDAIVLDEVDTMLDMGFVNNIKYILKKIAPKRQSLFFSATIPTALKGIIDSFLQDPVSISVKTRQSSDHINQSVITYKQDEKIDLLHDVLIQKEFNKGIIFAATKYATDKLARTLQQRGFKVAAIHGDKTQNQRKKSLSLFKDNQVNILIATDVVARGIDIDDVSHVINYDLPQTHEDYIHRIGRTGRANKIGQAITFIEAR